jgi:hypothetical protein
MYYEFVLFEKSSAPMRGRHAAITRRGGRGCEAEPNKPYWSSTREHKTCPVTTIAIMPHGAINLDCSPCGFQLVAMYSSGWVCKLAPTPGRCARTRMYMALIIEALPILDRISTAGDCNAPQDTNGRARRALITASIGSALHQPGLTSRDRKNSDWPEPSSRTSTTLRPSVTSAFADRPVRMCKLRRCRV